MGTTINWYEMLFGNAEVRKCDRWKEKMNDVNNADGMG